MLELRELEQSIRILPPQAMHDLQSFIQYLQYKYQVAPDVKTVKLEGLWEAVDFDVSDADVRALRQQVTQQLLSED